MEFLHILRNTNVTICNVSEIKYCISERCKMLRPPFQIELIAFEMDNRGMQYFKSIWYFLLVLLVQLVIRYFKVFLSYWMLEFEFALRVLSKYDSSWDGVVQQSLVSKTPSRH